MRCAVVARWLEMRVLDGIVGKLRGPMRLLAFSFLICALLTTPSRTEDDLYGQTVKLLQSAMVKACDIYPDCTKRVMSFAYFLWANRDKSDIQFNTMKCLGYSAVGRGYIWSPTKVLDDMTPTTAQEIAKEVCDCVVGSWGKDQVCPIDKMHALLPSG